MQKFPETLIILGAPRSGTNIMRDVLTSLPGFGTWPCDEINFVWKHGNIRYVYDDLPATAVTERTRRFVQRQFSRIAQKSNSSCVVEKTCANSMRVAYVDNIVPDARYVLLLRDGRDAVASIIRRWERPVPGRAYYMNKARFIAPGDLFWVFWQVLVKRLHGLVRSDAHSWSTWGPLSPEVEQYVNEGRPLADICALQWSQCVDKSVAHLETIDHSRWIAVSYEKFVRDPEAETARILELVSTTVDPADVREACKQVIADSVGKSRSFLDAEQSEKIKSCIEPAMKQANQILGVV